MTSGGQFAAAMEWLYRLHPSKRISVCLQYVQDSDPQVCTRDNVTALAAVGGNLNATLAA